eukprot:754819-Hanusia_phi.AAC.1
MVASPPEVDGQEVRGPEEQQRLARAPEGKRTIPGEKRYHPCCPPPREQSGGKDAADGSFGLVVEGERNEGMEEQKRDGINLVLRHDMSAELRGHDRCQHAKAQSRQGIRDQLRLHAGSLPATPSEMAVRLLIASFRIYLPLAFDHQQGILHLARRRNESASDDSDQAEH